MVLEVRKELILEDEIFTDEEAKRLILALVMGSDKGVPEERLKAFVDWASDAKSDYALVRLIEKGELVAWWDEEVSDWAYRTATDDEKAKLLS